MVAILAYDYFNQHHADREDTFNPSYSSKEALAALHGTLRSLIGSYPVDEQVVLDLPARALVEASAGADLLVVGTRGLGGFEGLLLGSVSERVLELARCPVAVVPEGARRPRSGAVVVGIDPSATSVRVLRWAAGEVRARQATLHIVHAWQPPYLDIPGCEPFVRSIKNSAQNLLQTATQDPAVAGLQVESHMPSAGASAALLGFADGASLIALGSRGLGRFGRVLLGSTSRQLAHHAPCPVVVVPADD